jgi:hypothetical protein
MMQREAAVDAVFRWTPNEGDEVAAPLVLGSSRPAQSVLERGSPGELLAVDPVISPAPVRVSRASLDWTALATSDDFWAGVFVGDMVSS